jgi:hypothetical protein
MNYQKCLRNNGYKADKILKKTRNSVVLKVKKDRKTYVAKVLLHNETDDTLEIRSMKTEIQALKYMRRKLKHVPFYAKFVEDFTCIRGNKIIEIVVMDYIKGTPLIEFEKKKMNSLWWKSLVHQLVLAMYILEDHKIIHNDMWDANVMIQKIPTDKTKKYIKIYYKDNNYFVPNAGFIVKLVDFQYTNQYTDTPAIYSAYVMSKTKRFQKEKKRLGWSRHFTRGSDLNQIMGILSDYKHVPKNLRKYLKEIVYENEDNKDFPYSIIHHNKLTSGKFMLKNINLIMKLID